MFPEQHAMLLNVSIGVCGRLLEKRASPTHTYGSNQLGARRNVHILRFPDHAIEGRHWRNNHRAHKGCSLAR
jgi:hypothetical protein